MKTSPAPARAAPYAGGGASTAAGRTAALLLFGCALILYAPGIGWGLPHASGPWGIHAWGSDEIAPLGPLAQSRIILLRESASFDPRYPFLAYLIQGVFMAPWLLFLQLSGQLQQVSTTYPFGLLDPVSSLAVLTLLGRASSLLLVSAIPVIAYYTAKRLWDRRTALVAGVFTLVLYPFFYYSRTSNVDGAALFFTALGLFHYAVCLRDGVTARRMMLLGIFAALATATKDHGYAVFAAAGAVLLVREFIRAGTTGGRQAAGPFAAGVAVALPTYLLASGAALNPAAFLRHVNFILHGSGASQFFYGSMPATPEGYARLFAATAGLLADSMGWPMLLAAFIGVIHCVRSDRTALLYLAPVVGLVLGVIVPVRFVLLRFLLPATYALSLVAAAGVVALAGWWVERRVIDSTRVAARPGMSVRRVVTVLTVLIAGWGLLRGADLTFQMLNDPRYELAGWLRQHARDGDRLGFYGAAAKLPPLEPGIRPVPGPYEQQAPAGSELVWPEFIVLLPQQPFERDAPAAGRA